MRRRERRIVIRRKPDVASASAAGRRMARNLGLPEESQDWIAGAIDEVSRHMLKRSRGSRGRRCTMRGRSGPGRLRISVGRGDRGVVFSARRPGRAGRGPDATRNGTPRQPDVNGGL